VKGEKFKLRICLHCQSCCEHRSVQRLNSQHLPMIRTTNIAELVPSGIFCLQTWFLQRSKHNSPRKIPVYMSIELLSINSCLSIKMKTHFDDIAEFYSGVLVAWRFDSQREQNLFSHFFFVGCFFGNYFKKMNKFQEGKVELRF